MRGRSFAVLVRVVFRADTADFHVAAVAEAVAGVLHAGEEVAGNLIAADLDLADLRVGILAGLRVDVEAGEDVRAIDTSADGDPADCRVVGRGHAGLATRTDDDGDEVWVAGIGA